MGSQDSHFTVFDDAQFQVRGRTLLYVVVLFAVVLLVTLLMLYTGWVSRFHHVPTVAPTPCLPKGLDLAVIGALPIVLYQQKGRDLEAGGGECSICLSVFEDGETVKVLPSCRHCYHSECVDAWLAAQSSCPLCRAQLPARRLVRDSV